MDLRVLIRVIVVTVLCSGFGVLDGVSRVVTVLRSGFLRGRP